MYIHIVKPNETLYSIAASYGVSPDLLISINGLLNPNRLIIGQSLLVLEPEVVYTVKPRDTLWSIANIYGTTTNELYRNNPSLGGLSALSVRQKLVIKYKEDGARPTISVGGYAYPFIDRALLRKTLPYITFLNPFTYGITPTGELVELDDEELISLAEDYGVTPFMHLSTLTESGNFSNELASDILNNADAQDNLISNIIATMKEKGYKGLDIDFEFILANDKEAYVLFLQKLTSRLRAEGLMVIAAVSPKTSDNQVGRLYEGLDYAGIGGAVDYVFLMTYEWGYTYGPAMAVAPINKVREVLDYAVTQIPANKILMGVPNYGYDWTLPFVQGQSKAQSISNERALELAIINNVPIQYDEAAMAPYFQYYSSDGKLHEVWFEDARSIKAKLELISEYGLAGVEYWNLMRPFTQNWSLINNLYKIKQ